jgi:hypothetical protein
VAGDASGLRIHFEDHDVPQGEAKRILGEPSLVVDRRILCYVPADPAAGWLFIDCHAEHATRYDVGRGRYTAVPGTEPLVRSVRLSGRDFEAGLILTLYGKTPRWGPGWWVDHPARTSPRNGLRSPRNSGKSTLPTHRSLSATPDTSAW